MKTFRFKRGIKNISEANIIILSRSSKINKKWWSLEQIHNCTEMILIHMTSKSPLMSSRFLRSRPTNSQVDPFSMERTQIGLIALKKWPNKTCQLFRTKYWESSSLQTPKSYSCSDMRWPWIRKTTRRRPSLRTFWCVAVLQVWCRSKIFIQKRENLR